MVTLVIWRSTGARKRRHTPVTRSDCWPGWHSKNALRSAKRTRRRRRTSTG